MADYQRAQLFEHFQPVSDIMSFAGCKEFSLILKD
jgi:hypothetical protein